jgi:hypothetical protein
MLNAAASRVSGSRTETLPPIFISLAPSKYIGYGVTANIAASHNSSDRGSSGFDSPYPSFFFFRGGSSEYMVKLHLLPNIRSWL